MNRATRAIAAAFAVLVIGLGLAACGGGSDSTSSAGGGGETEAAGGSEQASSDAGGGSADAAAAIKPYIGQPGPFPVVDPLKEVPKGANIDYMDCGTPICALIWEILAEAADTMGVNVSRIKAGGSANTVQPAFETVVAKKPDAVIVSGIDIGLWKQQAEELNDAGIPILTAGPTGVSDYVEVPQYAEAESEFSGKLMAGYIAAEMGDDSSVAFYNVPELPFSKIIGESLTAELEAVCPECTVRTVDIPVAAVGNTAPNQIVSDLQANPDTTVAAFPTDEVEIGLPQALNAAGLEIETLGNVPGPDNLQYLKEGKETAALGYDLPVAMWELLDQAAREITGQEITGTAAEGLSDRQFLTQEDITFDPSKGWTGYPDYKERYEKLWGVGG